MKEFQEILAAVLWRMSCGNSLACNTVVLHLRNFIILLAALSLYEYLGRFLIFSGICDLALRVIDACSKTCKVKIVHKIVSSSTLHGINF